MRLELSQGSKCQVDVGTAKVGCDPTGQFVRKVTVMLYFVADGCQSAVDSNGLGIISVRVGMSVPMIKGMKRRNDDFGSSVSLILKVYWSRAIPKQGVFGQ